MPEAPWKGLGTAQPDQEYMALLTYLPVKKYRTIPRFLSYAKRVEAQLAETKGIIGYSLRAKFLQRSFWTLSLWESEEALQAFVYEGFHTGVMKVLISDMGATNFVRWKIKGSACPPSWEEALRRRG